MIKYEKNTSNDETVLKGSIEIMKKYFIVSADILGIELINKDNYSLCRCGSSRGIEAWGRVVTHHDITESNRIRLIRGFTLRNHSTTNP